MNDLMFRILFQGVEEKESKNKWEKKFDKKFIVYGKKYKVKKFKIK